MDEPCHILGTHLLEYIATMGLYSTYADMKRTRDLFIRVLSCDQPDDLCLSIREQAVNLDHITLIYFLVLFW